MSQKNAVCLSDAESSKQVRARFGLTTAAVSLGLSCLGGMPAPAVAFPYHEFSPFWELGDWRSPRSHSSRRRSGAKAVDSAKPDATKQFSGPLILAVSIGSQRVTVYDNGTPVATSPISSGMAGHSTPTGVFSVIQKQRWHHSNLYSNAPMPYMQRITWSGVALHAGVVPGYPASHGCIRLPEGFAVRLWGMTKVGARVIVTRNEAAPYEIDHPRLAGLVKAPEPAPEVAVLNRPNAAANLDKSELVTGAVAAAATDAASGDGMSSKPLREGIAPSGLATSGAGSPQVETVADAGRPAERHAEITPSTPESVPTPRAKAVDAAQRPVPVSLFVSRKEGKLFVRKGFAPVFDIPVTIAHPEMPLGTHIFTASRPADDGVGLRWLAVSIGYDRAAADAVPTKGKLHAVRDERPPAPAAETLRQAAAEALDRIALPPDALERIVPLVAPGASLLISDHGLGEETGRDTDFIVVTK